jgi:vacuolar-type H+-ATPase subunit C/Vma6
MKRGWEDLVARVRGLTTRLLGRERLTALARSRDLLSLAAALEELGGGAWASEHRGPSAEELELMVRRMAASHLAIVALWSSDRITLLDPLYLDEDRRSVRALLRGAASGVPAEARLAGLVPTPALPERALEELANQRSIAAVCSLLAVWGHPFGAALLAPSRVPKLDLFRLELLMNTVYAERATAAARAVSRGDGARKDMIVFVRQVIDRENAWTAVQLAGHQSGARPDELFVAGGDRLSREVYLRSASAETRARALSILARAFSGTPYARVFAGAPEALEDAALAAELRSTIDAARRAPLGLAPVIAFFTRLRAEVRDLRFIIWRLASQAPPGGAELLVSVT